MIGDTHHLHTGGTSVIVRLDEGRLPVIIHWGQQVSDKDAAALARAVQPQRVSAGVDAPMLPSILPTQAEGWLGTPGIEGHAADGATTLRFRPVATEGDRSRLVVTAREENRYLELHLELELTKTGLLRVRARVSNRSDAEFQVHRLDLRLPLPPDATELLHTYGRHLRERAPQRQHFPVGTLVRESRGGKPGHSSPLVMVAGRTGFGFERGRVHGVHLAWSGSGRYFAERTADGARVLGAGEVLVPGEIRLAPGEEYAAPALVASWGEGLTALSGRVHDELRARPTHPRSPLVTINTWEAVYFDQGQEKLEAVLAVAAEIGVERFVVDDGWFKGRRDDTRGLGDWEVDPVTWPAGIGELADAVRARDMAFGIWVEPEMISPDSDLARQHPQWILGPPEGLPLPSRQQQVVDLAIPEARAHILERLDALVSGLGVDYLKWDHNRDLLEAVDHTDGRPVGHANVEASYLLMDELRARHPDLQIEACAGGGSRIDLAIVDRSERVWVSDCTDPLERLGIQRYTSLLLPPELMGTDISEERSHSTHRKAVLGFRAGVALLGSLGLQWDVTRLDADGRAELAEWIRIYKDVRELVANGRLVFADLADPTADVRGVVSKDCSRAIYTYVQVAASDTYPPERIHLPGLDPHATYSVTLRWCGTRSYGLAPLPWSEEPLVLSGRALGSVGLQPPVIYPEHLVVLEVNHAASRVDSDTYDL